MDLVKSGWVADENSIHLGVPINKIDKENRLVSGFATLNNIDTAKDVVLAEASKKAFERARGNVREMHQPIAAGKIVDFREDEFFYKGDFYRGIYATVYISKGAQDTWEKVLDGTLTGFSIGGSITDQETKFVKDAGDHGETIRFIKGYDLVELSLVDNPGNQLTNFDSIVKMLTFEGDKGNRIMKGMVAETVIVNVFWCGTDEIAKNSTNAEETCLSCGLAMEQIGWFERGEDNAVKTASAVANFLRHKEGDGTVNKQAKTAQGEGGVDMSDEKTKEDAKEEAAAAGVEVKQEEGEPATLVNAPEVVESDEEDEKEEASGEKVDAVALAEGAQEPEDSAETDEKFEEKREEAQAKADEENKKEEAAMPDFEKMFSDLKDSLASEFKKSLDELRTDLESKIEGEQGEVTKRLDTLEGSTAVKKSGEVETEPVKKAKESLWSGTFFDAKN